MAKTMCKTYQRLFSLVCVQNTLLHTYSPNKSNLWFSSAEQNRKKSWALLRENFKQNEEGYGLLVDKLSRTATVKQKLGKTMQRAVLGTKHLLTAVGLKMTVGEADWENAAEQNSPSDYHTERRVFLCRLNQFTFPLEGVVCYVGSINAKVNMS